MLAYIIIVRINGTTPVSSSAIHLTLSTDTSTVPVSPTVSSTVSPTMSSTVPSTYTVSYTFETTTVASKKDWDIIGYCEVKSSVATIHHTCTIYSHHTSYMYYII